MRHRILFLFLFTVPFLGFTQTDTLIVHDEPVLVNQEIYFSPDKPPTMKSIDLGIGLSSIGSYINYNPELKSMHLIKNVSLYAGMVLQKKKWFSKFGLAIQRFSYDNQYTEFVTVEEQQTVTVTDTTKSYEVEYVEDEYYPDGRYDTTVIIVIRQRDSTYTVESQEERGRVRIKKRTFLQVPIAIGYDFSLRNWTLNTSVVVTPSVLVEESKFTMMTHVGATVAIFYDVFNSIAIGPSINFQWSAGLNNHVLNSMPNLMWGTKINLRYKF